MGPQSNGNSYCGLFVTITLNGKSVVAKVVDKCMGCTGKSIDLSNAAWDALGVSRDVGRTQAEWCFN
jgi:rare lipoprotein A (peptidoglycan hydrolase)